MRDHHHFTIIQVMDKWICNFDDHWLCTLWFQSQDMVLLLDPVHFRKCEACLVIGSILKTLIGTPWIGPWHVKRLEACLLIGACLLIWTIEYMGCNSKHFRWCFKLFIIYQWERNPIGIPISIEASHQFCHILLLATLPFFPTKKIHSFLRSDSFHKNLSVIA